MGERLASILTTDLSEKTVKLNNICARLNIKNARLKVRVRAAPTGPDAGGFYERGRDLSGQPQRSHIQNQTCKPRCRRAGNLVICKADVSLALEWAVSFSNND